MKATTFVILIFFSVWITVDSRKNHDFDVRQHLSTVTRYGEVAGVPGNRFVPTTIPETCVPIHLNLVARHGTRSPTKKRIRELDGLAIRLKELITDAKGRLVRLSNVPDWLLSFESPWKGKMTGGELISQGEDELYQLGIRIREKFPELFNEPYHPDVYTIKSTQVPRASASAVAFGMGLLKERGNLGPGQNRAFAVISESRASDLMLRFFDSCENYKSYRERHEPVVDKLKEPILDGITSVLASRYGLNFSRQDIASLWFLCKQEASLLNVTAQACGLFNSSEVALLEWTDDVEVFILKGYGNSVNYRMGVPLLQDIVQSMEQAIRAKEENRIPGSFEKARLRFAHAETIVPFSCLLGLFLEGSDFEKIQKEETLDLLPRPPLGRQWRGSVVAPFAANNMLVLYSCSDEISNKYFVQVLHNEFPISLPGCNNSDFCPFDVFKEKIVAPHFEHDYRVTCSVKQERPLQVSLMSKLAKFFRRLFTHGDKSAYNKDEL